MASTSNYSILLDAEFNASQIKRNLEQAIRGTTAKIDVDGSGARDATNAVEDLDRAGEDASVTYQVLNKILSESIKILTSMADQVFELDDTLVEFRKVSDLEGQALDKYVDKLSKSREMVARTT